LSTATTGGAPVSLTVSVGNASAYRLSAASTNIAAGASDALTLKLVDQYQNVITTFSGDKNLTFSGLSASTNGTQPTVTDKTTTPVNLGMATTITFASGSGRHGRSIIHCHHRRDERHTDGFSRRPKCFPPQRRHRDAHGRGSRCP